MKNKKKFANFLNNSDSLYLKSLKMFKWSGLILIIILTVLALWMYIDTDL